MSENVKRVSHFEGIADWYDMVINDPKKRGVLNNAFNKLLVKLVGRGKA